MTRLRSRLGAWSLPAALVLCPLPARGQACEPWTWGNPLPQGDLLGQVRFLGGRLVSVGGAGRILTSPPAADAWTVPHSGVIQSLEAVAWDGALYVVVGGQGTILTSPDAVTWTPRVSGTSLRLRGVTWDGAQFVAVGDAGKILTSPDGVAWTPRTSNTANSLVAVTRGGALLVAVGDGGRIVTSPDGVTWTLRTSGTNHNFTGVAWNGSRFVASASTPLPPEIETGVFAHSDDGIAWTALGSTYMATDVIWTDAEFKAVARIKQTGRLVVIGSLDGVAWTARRLGHMASPQSLAWSGEVFVVVGEMGRIVSGAPSQPWVPRSHGPRDDLRGLAWNGQRFVALGNSEQVLVSDDGLSWTAHPIGADEYWVGVAWGNGRFAALGHLGAVMTSPDGIQWTQHADLPVNNFNDLLWNGTKFVGAGHTINGGVFVTSADGVSWALQTTPLPVKGLAWNGALHVAVGAVGSILTSPDAVSWTPRDSGTTDLLEGVTWSAPPGGPPTAVAVGYGNPATILSSTDGGVTWTAHASASSLPLHDVAWSGSEYVAVGQSGVVLRSPDLQAWTRDDWATQGTIEDVDAVGSQLFAVGDNGTSVRWPCPALAPER
jgi:hypothetical protein